jgi:hypothetical protein
LQLPYHAQTKGNATVPTSSADRRSHSAATSTRQWLDRPANQTGDADPQYHSAPNRQRRPFDRDLDQPSVALPPAAVSQAFAINRSARAAAVIVNRLIKGYNGILAVHNLNFIVEPGR